MVLESCAARGNLTMRRILLVALALLAGGWIGAQAQSQAEAKVPAKAAEKSSTKATPKAAQAETFGPPNKGVGSPNAPITLEVYSDYMCPQCRNFYLNTLRPLMGDYAATGKVYLVHHDYPLPIPAHKYNWDAARWGTAAARIGKFEEVDRALYENEPAWEADGNIQKMLATVLSPADLKRVQKQVAPCLNQTPPGFRPTAPAGQSCSLDAYINQDISAGKQVPVQATPTYVIYFKGQRMAPGSGFVSWPILKQFFDSLLTP